MVKIQVSSLFLLEEEEEHSEKSFSEKKVDSLLKLFLCVHLIIMI